ncbi:lysoplasmalogenase [Oceanobacillus sp. FSL K6-2867]|uniref:lysoplasmalogenase n=1 Tax=Oceanobacillus sp. FSL K6-2867 TaxID=2954748 RepID=UPI0030DDAEED
MILYQLPLLILTMALVYLFIAPAEPLFFSLFFKLVPMIMILIYALQLLPRKKSRTHLLLISGLIFCIIGDATLHWFLIGLTAFLIGHLFYMAGFITQWSFSIIRLAMVFPIAGSALFIGSRLVVSLKIEGNEGLVLPVTAYIFIISLMAFSAMMTGNGWAIAGSVLFLISDAILAWNMFIAPIHSSNVFVMLPYYGGQFLIAHSLSSIVAGGNRIVW